MQYNQNAKNNLELVLFKVGLNITNSRNEKLQITESEVVLSVLRVLLHSNLVLLVDIIAPLASLVLVAVFVVALLISGT